MSTEIDNDERITEARLSTRDVLAMTNPARDLARRGDELIAAHFAETPIVLDVIKRRGFNPFPIILHSMRTPLDMTQDATTFRIVEKMRAVEAYRG